MIKFSVNGSGRTDPRTKVSVHVADRPGNGDSRRWSRTIAGQTYSFCLVEMPSGEVRWFVSRFNGYAGGPRWGCAWSPHREWTFNRGSSQ